MKLKTVYSIALTTALVAGSTSTMAALFDFTVDPDASSPATNFVADKITGNYAETIDLNLNGTFNASIKWQAGQFVGNDGIDPVLPGTSRLGVDYSLYGLYVGSGTFSTVAGITSFIFNSSMLELYFDDNLDTTFTDPGAGNATSQWTTGNTTDDKLLASGTFTGPSNASSNGGILDGTCSGANCGSFGVTNTFSLTDNTVDPLINGEKFFIDPRPFYNVTLASGQFNAFDAIPGTTQKANGSADFIFTNVPEPTTLMLMGLGLLGFGVKSRKKA